METQLPFNGPCQSRISRDECPALFPVLVNAKPANDGNGVILHLRGVDDKETTIRTGDLLPAKRVSSIEEVNVLQQPLQKVDGAITFSPFEVKFIRLIQ